ncbi:mono-functional DNA-alkylating methyl methanesulfonate N-term-domain-containing protein [Podospora appendiculata]|uniref:Mono-functional DNA-alkylating methyl methanesulfonate N-term-domain-containing protein n=1 Tax=Podospora appendiculata TaxID=314037 RepID=A0AAE1CC38_9PEZI|nr:mono-functional DNA-alkylating methyl methanesulfonate N-term-domain-containing protein [Podospora appendiculata]
MPMDFHTSVLRGGEWVTETRNLHEILKANSNAKGSARPRLLKPPQCGILSRTVVESPQVRFILPLRLRSSRDNDVAFIGDHFVEIRELQADGQFKDIAKKTDFGSRIRNASVIGSSNAEPIVKTEHSSTPPEVSSQASLLPPQLLLLVLECGDCVFIFLRPTPGDEFEFVSTRFASRKEQQLNYPGFHLAVDPSSRYMALAAAQDFFVVYELESVKKLSHDYMNNRPLNPIKAYRLRAVQGVIHKVTFLYPRPEDEHHHVILLLLVVKDGKSRMVTYEWELGNDLKAVFAEEKTGYRMPIENQMPLLLIPLTVKSAFIAVSPNQLAVCTEGLHGPPHFDTIEISPHSATTAHYGLMGPLWTAWARPFRLPPYFRNQDCIYLAREDGVVFYLESDADGTVERSTPMDTFDCNISSAFACPIVPDADVLVLGSDSGPGGWFKAMSRQHPEHLGTLENWSPAVDFATTDECLTWNQAVDEKEEAVLPWLDRSLRKPDRVFATAGCGKKGSITEYRYGLKASIGLEMEYGPGLKLAWLFPSRHSTQPNGFHLLLSKPDCTEVLYMEQDCSEASGADSSTIAYDLSSPTLAVAHSERLLVQITANFVTLVTPDRHAQFSYGEILAGRTDLTICDACILDDRCAISTYNGPEFQVHVFKIDSEDLSLIGVNSINVEGDVTALAMNEQHNVLAGIWKHNRPFLLSFSLQKGYQDPEEIDLLEDLMRKAGHTRHETQSAIEPISSIGSIPDAVIVGTRCGEVITLTHEAGSDQLVIESEKFGTAAVKITRACAPQTNDCEPALLISCDRNLVLLGAHRSGSGPAVQFKTKLQVWPVAEGNLGAPTPPVDYVVAWDLPSENQDVSQLLIISGPRLLLAELGQKPGPVHRQIPIGGTPTKIIYSQTLQCLVVAVNIGDKPTLMFIDPDSGEDIGVPTDKTFSRIDKNGDPIEFVSGLGKPGDRIMGLKEWEAKKEKDVWRFIIVITRYGRLLVVSTKKEALAPDQPGQPRIVYWLRFQKKSLDRPVYSVLSYNDGLIYCVGQTIHWDVLDHADKKLKTIKTYELTSPAISLRIVNNRLMVLTNSSSLEIINPVVGQGDESPAGLLHVDPKNRNATHMMEIAGPQPEQPLGSIVLVADRDCGVAGLWIPWQIPGKECEQLFEAELPTSVRRFRRGRTRPIWEQQRHVPKFGRLPSTIDDADILGISLDGLMQHFTLINTEAWRFLRFIQNMAMTSEELCPFTYKRVNLGEFNPEPRAGRGLEMHIDGDLLRRCLEKRVLERLISSSEHVERFGQLLDELVDNLGGRERYFQLAYEIIEYFLRPVL